MHPRYPDFTLRLPDWVAAFVAGRDAVFPDVESRAAFVIELSRRNVEHRTGGPFGAAVFDTATQRLIAPGVNLVESAGASCAHAEIVALSVAQAALGTFDLSAPGLPPCELVSSADPCIMCLGAVHWSGVRTLVCAADKDDAEAAGFDEGPVPSGWPAELETRGVAVTRGVLRHRAADVLTGYARNGHNIYNPSHRRD